MLQGLAREYPICALVLEWREVTKLKNTYVDVIPQLVDPRDGRLRTEFNQTATATGRLSSTNPNLQNIPGSRRARPADSARLRRARRRLRVPAADYSQIELRLMAHLSGDRAMRTAFEEGQDIHDFTARQIFGIAPGDAVDANQRRMAKSVNFGLFYGMSDFGLRAAAGDQPRRSQGDHDRILRALSRRARIHRSHDRRGAQQRIRLDDSRDEGVICPACISGNYMLRAAAEREATNAPLQGSAADLMKLAMVRIDRALDERGSGRDDALADPRRADIRSRKSVLQRSRRIWYAITWSAPSSYRCRWK